MYFDPNILNQTKLFKSEEVQMLNHVKTNFNYKLQDKNIDDLRSLFLLANDPRYITNQNEFLKVFETLDLECYLRLQSMETKDIFDILRIYVQITPGKIVKHKFYGGAINKLSQEIDELTKNELLQFMFFLGLQKKNKKAQSILRTCMKKMNDDFIKALSPEELCVICSATFKTTTKITNKPFLNRVKDFINDNLYILKDPAIFITLVKTIRQNQCQDDNLLSTISCAVFFNKTLQYYGFAAMCHILALYADYLYHDPNILKYFSAKCVEELQNSELVHRRAYLTEQIRDKDLKRLLWCLSRLGYGLDVDTIKTDLIPNVVERIQKGGLHKDPHSLVEIILYLWMMNYQAVELLPYVLTQENVNYIYESNLNKRLNLLLTAIYFENRPVFRNLNVKIRGSPRFDKEDQVNKRPVLKRVFDGLKVILPKTELNKFEFTSQIPYIQIVGITGFKKNIYKAVHVEVLDEETSLKNSDSLPTGLMQMKLRILDGSEEGLVVVRSAF